MDIEQLQEDEEKLQKEINKLTYEISSLKEKRVSKQEELNEIKRNIEIINSEVTISDHAVVRYFERVLGFNIDEVRDKICPLNVKEQIKVLTNCKYPVENFEIVAKNNKIVTVQNL